MKHPMMPRPGDVIAAKYRLDRVAGEGGMGIVYAAEHLILNQRVAVKVLLPDAAASETIIERFTREARAAAKLDSEHVARVLDAGSLASGAPFLVMEYLEGCNLEELLELQKTLPVADVADYMVQALDGLAHAHASNIVHRDLKPANLFLACRPDGKNEIKVLDFGISKTTNKPEDKRLTGHHVLGSPVYMSPEQLRNAADIDGRADVWSIGVVAYELLTGVTPFDGEGVGEIFAAILEQQPVPLCERNPKVPKELSDVVAKCLRRDREERWADAGQLAKALAPFGSDPHAAMIERAEQVLARARRLAVAKTPLEMQRVVDAIEAAAERAITISKSSPPNPITSTHDTVADPAKVDVRTRLSAFARHSPVRAGSALAIVLALAGLSVFGFARMRRSASTATAAAHAPRVVGLDDRPTAAISASVVATSAVEEAPLVMDLPSTPNPAAKSATGTARGAKGPQAKPQRPKFLNTRE